MIQNTKRIQANLNKCHSPIGVWAESYRHEIRLTAELMLLSSRIGRALLTAQQVPKEPHPDAESVSKTKLHTPTDHKIADNINDGGKALSPRRNSIAVDSLQPTFRTDIANKYVFCYINLDICSKIHFTINC